MTEEPSRTNAGMAWGHPFATTPDLSEASVSTFARLVVSVAPRSSRPHQDDDTQRRFVVTAGSMAHHAFHTAQECADWLGSLGLVPIGDLAEAGRNGISGGVTLTVLGQYRRASHRSYDAFYGVDGDVAPLMDCGRWTVGVTSRDADGVRTLHHLNPNMRRRPDFPIREAAAAAVPSLTFHPLLGTKTMAPVGAATRSGLLSKAEAQGIQSDQIEFYGRRWGTDRVRALVMAADTSGELADGEHDVATINRHIPRGGKIEAMIAAQRWTPARTPPQGPSAHTGMVAGSGLQPMPAGGFANDEEQAEWMAEAIAAKVGRTLAAQGVATSIRGDDMAPLVLVGLRLAVGRAVLPVTGRA